MKYSLSNFNKVILESGYNEKLALILIDLYKYMIEKEWIGACHATVSVLYVILKEEGFNPKLCIGEVKKGNIIFDHSWIELDNKVIDLAISMTLNNGEPMNSPVILDTNIDSLNKHEIIYGIDGNGLDIEALIALNSSFNDYMDNFPFHNDGLWGVMEDITNKKININKLKIKYSNTQRYYINDKKLDNINF